MDWGLGTLDSELGGETERPVQTDLGVGRLERDGPALETVAVVSGTGFNIATKLMQETSPTICSDFHAAKTVGQAGRSRLPRLNPDQEQAG